MKKSISRILGIALMLIGIIFLSDSFQITGFAIFEDISRTTGSIVGIAFILGGVLLLFYERKNEGGLEVLTKERLVTSKEFGERFQRKEPNKNKRFIVLDTSAILAYEPTEIEALLKKYETVYVPNSVINEVRNPKVRKLLEEYSHYEKGYEKHNYRKIARDTLQQTEKPQLRKFLLPYLNGSKQVRTRKESVEIQEKTKRLRSIMEKEGMGLEEAEADTPWALKKIKDYLDRHCAVSDTDVDVLAMGLYGARHHNHAMIGEKDIDFRQAIGLIKKKHPKIGNYIDYIEPYKKAA